MSRWAICLIVAAACSLGDVLPSEKELRLTGHARLLKDRVRLTRARNDQAGSVWRSQRQYVARGFDTRFTFQFTDQGGLGDGADGLAFVIQNSGANALGGFGGSGGFGGGDGSSGHGNGRSIPFSLAVFFDSYYNQENDDPSDNALHICINGKPKDLQWPPSRLAVVPQLPVELKGRQRHTARVKYNPPILSVYLDDDLLVETPVELSLVTDREGKAWVGFTAATGGGYENHDLLSWDWSTSAESSISMVESTISFVLKECLPGKNLCTPEEEIVEEKSPGSYRIILPAHLERGVRIPNPGGRPVTIVKSHGVVCWEVNKGSSGCGGSPDVIMSQTSDGNTRFTIRDPGKNYADNEGYLEFHVELR